MGLLYGLWAPDLTLSELKHRYGADSLQTVQVDGLTIHYQDTGPRDAPVLVLLHGFGSSLQTWDVWAAKLELNYRVIRLDLPGFGLTGPSPLHDYSEANDLATLVAAAYKQPVLRELSTSHGREIEVGQRTLQYNNTNRLVKSANWDIGLQKTGYISEAGKCLVMQARVDSREVIIVLLDAAGSQSRFADAQRLRKWLLERPNDAAQSQASPQHNAMLVDRF
jgi:hypothetical protein